MIQLRLSWKSVSIRSNGHGERNPRHEEWLNVVPHMVVV